MGFPRVSILKIKYLDGKQEPSKPCLSRTCRIFLNFSYFSSDPCSTIFNVETKFYDPGSLGNDTYIAANIILTLSSSRGHIFSKEETDMKSKSSTLENQGIDKSIFPCFCRFENFLAFENWIKHEKRNAIYEVFKG